MFIKANGYWYASYYCQDERLRYPTRVKKDSKAKSDKLRLDRIEKIISQYVANCEILEQEVLADELRQHLDEQLAKAPKEKGDWVKDWGNMVSAMRSGQLLKPDGNRFSEITCQNYEKYLVVLQKYEGATGVKWSYRITIDNYRDFLKWLIKCEFSRNYIAGIVTYLAAFLNKMYQAKKHRNKVFEHPEFRYSSEDADTVALTVEELTRLYELPLKGAQERARDVFVFGCWVALRAEDLQRINDYKRVGDVFEILTQKTGEKVIIPMHWMADAIYTKYNGNLPVYSTPEGLNYHLPTICKQAKIVDQKLIAMTKGGHRQAEYWAKYDLVSVHTARRTFATIMYKEKFPVKAIMKITGHKTERAFFRYVRIGKEEAAEMMLQSNFFKKPS